MLWLLIEIAIYIASTVLTMYLASKGNALKASGLGDFQAPTAEEGRAIPVVYGTVKLAAPNVVWYGDLKVSPLKAGGWATFGFKKTYGYRYFLGMDLMLCHGPIDGLAAQGAASSMAGKCVGDGYVKSLAAAPGPDPYTVVLIATDATHFGITVQRPQDALPVAEGVLVVGSTYTSAPHGLLLTILIAEGPTTPFEPGDQFSFTVSQPSAIFAGDRAVPYGTTASGPGVATLELDARNLFGGDKQGGGIVGRVSFYFGTPDQPSNAYLAGKLPGASIVPSYAGYCHAVCEQLYLGTTNQVSNLAFVVTRRPDPLAHGTGDIGGDANPAWIIYDMMTSTIYGLGVAPARFDADSFKAAATTLKNEGLGMSLQVDTKGSADSWLSDILRHISGVVYTDPATGLWTLTLVRDDYDPDALVEIGDADMLEPPEFARINWDETLNEIKVRYIDRSLYFTPRIAQSQETANYATRGQLASDTQDFLGLSNMNIAQVVASRELKAHSYPLGRVRLKVTRWAWNFRIGGVFAFTNTKLGFVRVPYRISAMNYGELTKGEIQIDAVEDAFGIAYTAYTPPTSFGGWGDPSPVGPPPPPLAEELFESPYALNLSVQRFVYLLAARGDSISIACDVQSDTGGPLALTNEDQPFTPYGTLRDGCAIKPENPGTLVVENGIDLDTLAGADLNFFLIDDEILSFSTVALSSDGSCSLAGILRGLLDTLPQAHAPGAGVWFFGEGAAQVQPGPFSSDVTVEAKALPKNAYGETNPVQVAAVTLALASRALKPYPPGAVLANDVYYPSSTLGDLVIAWADRHRLNEGQTVVRQDDASFPGGIEGNYHIVLVIGGTTVSNLVGATGNAFAFSVADRLAVMDTGPLVFQITPTNGALAGRTRTLSFYMSGFGMCFGEAFGGFQG